MVRWLTFILQMFMHVLKIHSVKIDYAALALAMGNGEFFVRFSSILGGDILLYGHSGVECFLFVCSLQRLP